MFKNSIMDEVMEEEDLREEPVDEKDDRDDV
jgi:hypothetical protein